MRMTNYNELRDGQEFYANGYKKGYEDAKKEYARPQGEWIRTGQENVYGGVVIKCSHCGITLVTSPERFEYAENYCDMCGAKMKIEDSETASRDPRQGREVR